jgi:sugar-specific transcriptional regulator TrmB
VKYAINCWTSVDNISTTEYTWDMAIQDLLREIGLNDKEIKVYLTLLRSNKLRPSSLSRLTKINRATVYSVAKGLIAKGIVSEDLGGSTAYLTALPPESLKEIINRPKRELAQKEKIINAAIRQLNLVSPEENFSIPKIRFVQEDKIEDFLYTSGVKWVKELISHDGVWWSFQDHSFVEQYEDFVEWISKTKEYKNPKVISKLMTNSAPIEEKVMEKIPRSKRQLKFIPGLNFTSSIWISGDYLVMISTRSHPFYLVEIYDAALSSNLREIFKKVWDLSN